MELFWNLDKLLGQFLEPLLCYVHQQQWHKAAVCHWGGFSPKAARLIELSITAYLWWIWQSPQPLGQPCEASSPRYISLDKARLSTLPFITLGCPCLAPVIAEILPPACSPPLLTVSMKHPILMWDSGTASSVLLFILSYATVTSSKESLESLHAFLGRHIPTC